MEIYITASHFGYMKNVRVLHVEDDENWRNTLNRLLSKQGFSVDGTATLTKALTLLAENLYHLVILDIRLSDEDYKNSDGMNILKEIRRMDFGSTSIIMLSAFGLSSQMREAYSEYHIFDFLDKGDFRKEDFIETVSRAISNLEINSELEIVWEQSSAGEIVSNHLIYGRLTKEREDLRNLLTIELEDLLKRLFHKAKSILVKPYFTGIKSSSALLWVKPFIENTGADSSILVKIGEAQNIQTELENFKKYAKPFILNTPLTIIKDERFTPRLGVIAYGLAGDKGEITSFGEYFKRAEFSEIKEVLESLFWDTCGAWYSNRGVQKLLDLSSYYQDKFKINIEKVEDLLRRYLSATGGYLLSNKFFSLDFVENRVFTNPVQDITKDDRVAATFECINHGNLHPWNFFVDKRKKTWLFDFEKTEIAHYLRDITFLDSTIRLTLLETDSATLEERINLEEFLFKNGFAANTQIEAASLPEDIRENKSLAKVALSILQLRNLSSRLSGNGNQTDTALEYYTALLYSALYILKFTLLSDIQRQQALISASMAADAIRESIYGIYTELGADFKQHSINTEHLKGLAYVSHELRRPLGHIKSALQLIVAEKYGLLNSKQKEILTIAGESLETELSLLERLLYFTKFNLGFFTVSLDKCNVSDCIRIAIQESEHELQRKGLNYQINIPQTGIEILGDADLLRRAFSNVISNAVKFTASGEIRVSLETKESQVFIEIHDTGIGITKDMLPQIYEAFHQGDQSLARQYEGLGIGLNFTKQILSSHNGKIQVIRSVCKGKDQLADTFVKSESETDGTTFQIILPEYKP